MKKLFTKIVTVYVVIASLALVLKVGDNMLAKASTSNTPDQCGTNNGWVWNGTQCVNFCDQNHPWDPIIGKCSNGYGYSGYGYVSPNSNFAGNCAAYGSNFYWNGSVCAQIVPGQNATYLGNPFNGGYTTPVYNYVPVNSYNNYVPYVQTNTCNSCNVVNPAPRVVTTYYIYTTTTTSVPTYYNYYSNNYSNYTYLGDSYGYNNYWDCDYSDYINVGYYDIYGHYHF